MLYLPFIAFWVIIWIGREELGWKWSLILIGLWAVLLAGFILLSIPSYYFVVVQALADAILVIVIFGGDIRLH